MADQTFHTPNFGDEEFDIPPIALPPSHDPHIHHGNISYPPQMGMHGVSNQGQHSQQQHYMYLPEHMTTPMTMNSPVSYGGSPPTYTTLSSPHPHPSSQSPMGNPQQQHMMHHPQQQGARPHPQSVMGTNVAPRRSPSNNSSTSPPNPETTTSEDSDDSHPQGAIVGGVIATGKRPSPEPDVRTIVTPVVAAKKQKPQKKKKKRDPNEPQKPVSAYALFFRDTQAAIKGQNPNASFGEVSKIVASMWDALDADHKNVYKKKTEAAKKEYLKALAAYRASLVSKGAPTDGSGMYPPPNFNANMPTPQQQHYQAPQNYYANQSQQQTPPQQHKKSPQSQQQQPSQQQSLPPPNQPHHGSNQQQSGHPMMAQMAATHHMDNQQQQQYGHPMNHAAGYINSNMQMADGHNHPQQVGNSPNMHPASGGGHGQMNPGSVMNHMGPDGQNHTQRQICVRNGCSNIASSPMEADMQGYDEGYCSSQCVVSHCRDVFTNWVSTNQSGNPNYGNGMKYAGPPAGTVVGADGISYVT